MPRPSQLLGVFLMITLAAVFVIVSSFIRGGKEGGGGTDRHSTTLLSDDAQASLSFTQSDGVIRVILRLDPASAGNTLWMVNSSDPVDWTINAYGQLIVNNTVLTPVVGGDKHSIKVHASGFLWIVSEDRRYRYDIIGRYHNNKGICRPILADDPSPPVSHLYTSYSDCLDHSDS